MKYKIGIMVIDYDVYIGNLPCIKHEIEKSNIEVIAITNGWLTQSNIGLMDGFRYYDVSVFLQMPYDYLIIASQKEDFWTIRGKIGNRIHCGVEAIFSSYIFDIIDFDFKQYIELVKSKVSIISINCLGGITYANLFLEFMSPTINLRFENEEHFLRFISNMDYYFSQNIEYDGTECEEEIGEYPAGRIDDVRIRFVHYKSFEEAVDKWNKRKSRVNKNNILLMMFTENPVAAKSFAAIEDFRKVVFTAGDYGVENQIDLSPMFDICSLSDAGKIALLTANGELHLYNAIKMLNGYGDYLETRIR